MNVTTTISTERPNPSFVWNPISGFELHNLVTEKIGTGDAADSFAQKTLDILRDCVSPAESARRTGLVVGKVQSGKTLSFTSVAAAAHDNDFRLIVVLAGTKKILAQQTRVRLLKDLCIEEHSMRPWRAYHNPAVGESASLRQLMEAWDRPNTPRKLKKTAIITVHKNPSKLTALSDLLSHVGSANLGSPLLIDDEADQAGLNTQVRQGAESPTYQAILRLRGVLPSHTYLQYTATPQANLLISLLDLLSPDFAHVLSPGVGYIGGYELFGDEAVGGGALRPIPPHDIPDEGDYEAEPPASLHYAMRLFFIGVAHWLLQADGDGESNRSMMVHPSVRKGSHDLYASWVNARVAAWRQILEDSENPDRDMLVSEFEDAYNDLARTAQLESFEVLAEQLVNAISVTEVKVVNSGGTIDIPWKQQPVWLLVGGANLDRGFTVEGLTVTYMPRGPGVGNADTVQQRGRFFGYKQSYLGFCRIFLEPDIGEMFQVYVTHERSFHNWLAASIASGLELRQLQREFVIDPSMRPTRAAVLGDNVDRVRLSPWFRQETPTQSIDDCRYNAQVFQEFLDQEGVRLFEDDPGTPRASERADHQRHQWSESVSLQRMYEDLLARARIPGSEDTSKWLAALLLIEEWLDKNPDDLCTVVRMRPGQQTQRATKLRTSDMIRRLENPFQGAHPDKEGAIYPGDMKIRSNHVTLQLHTIDLFDGLVSKGVLLQSHVPIFALWLDEPLRSDVVSLRSQA